MEKLFDFQVGQEVFDTVFFPSDKLIITEMHGNEISVSLNGKNQAVIYTVDGIRKYNCKLEFPTLSMHPYKIDFKGFFQPEKTTSISAEKEYFSEEYLETHYEMANRLNYFHSETDLLEPIFNQKEYGGIGGCYILAKEWTDEFQLKYKDANWGEDGLDWHDTLHNFISAKLL